MENQSVNQMLNVEGRVCINKTENMQELEPKTTEFGGKYYETLPPGTRVAALDDFYDHMGRLIINKPYLVKSMVQPDRYWANRVNSRFPYSVDFKLFLDNELVYIFNENE